MAAARSTRRKILLSHHYHHFERPFDRLRWTAFYLAFGPCLDAVTYPTEFTRNEALRIAPWLRSRAHVVRYGFAVHYTNEPQRLEERREARAKLRIPQDAFVVGNAGWLIQRKRFDVFLRTAALIAGQVPRAQFMICGGGPEEASLRELAAELGIAERVRFEGWVQDVAQHYRAWDALLFNSDFDTCPCTPMEAASYGCICAASCLYGGLSEFLESGRTGVLLNRHDAHQLARPLVELVGSPLLALKLREGAAARLRDEFSMKEGLRFYEAYFGSGNE
jgi:glycosyltransferase involved in cell wall biosynthesis